MATIGDRIRLRELCAKSVEKSKDQSNDERKSYRKLVRGRKWKSACSQSHRQRSFQFLCLADRHSFKTPSSIERQMLYKAGLGLKKVKLDPNDDEDTVK